MSDGDKSRWIAATDIVKGQNELIAIEFDEDIHQLNSIFKKYNYQGYRWNFEYQIKKVAWLFKDLVAVSSSIIYNINSRQFMCSI